MRHHVAVKFLAVALCALALLTAVLIGACAGFLPHNLTRARIFMGDSGSMLLGLLLAASTIAVTGQVDPARLSGADFFGQFLPILLPIGVMIVPFLDFALAVLRRIGSGKSPFHADKAHLHHRLLSIGHSKLTAVLIMYTWTVVISVGLLLPLVLVPEALVLPVGGVVAGHQAGALFFQGQDVVADAV